MASVRCDSFSVKRRWIPCNRAAAPAAGSLVFGTEVRLPQRWQLTLIPIAARLTTSDMLQCSQRKKISRSPSVFSAKSFAASACTGTERAAAIPDQRSRFKARVSDWLGSGNSRPQNRDGLSRFGRARPTVDFYYLFCYNGLRTSAPAGSSSAREHTWSSSRPERIFHCYG
jgi:hypothetical protein